MSALTPRVVYVSPPPPPLGCLVQEAELELDPSYLDQFTELNHVLEALRSRNVEPALE